MIVPATYLLKIQAVPLLQKATHVRPESKFSLVLQFYLCPIGLLIDC